MLLSRKLFNDFFPNFKNISTIELEKMLNAIGIEVESVFKYEKTNNLIVGEIIECDKHPDAKNLNVCKVLIGNNVINQIVCGANNVRKGLKVIVAQVNAVMIDGRKIESRKIRNVDSCGMICAYSELTNRNDFLPESEKNEIIELDNNALVGDNDPLKYIGFDDEILDLSIPSNRNELNGIMGIGLDLISIYFPEILTNFDIDFSEYPKNNIDIDTDNAICNFFGTIHLKKIKNKKSSWKVKYLLMNSGFVPKNTMVDISNLNTIITGNPSHCYDANYIKDKIVIKTNDSKTKFIALNDKTYEIDKNEGIFAFSNNKEISLVGMIGSKESSINETTSDVIFEIGNFDNLLIKKLNDKLNLRTDAANIFSKKIPLWITLKSFETLINLLKKSDSEFCGINYTNVKLKQKEIEYNYKKIINLLGVEIKENELISILNNIGIKLSENKLIPPIYRCDIENIYDIVEEIVKSININNLEEKPINSTLIDFHTNFFEENREDLELKLINKGFSQIKSLNLTSKENNDKFNLFNAKKWIKIINPISKEREYFRNNLIQQHIEIISNNSSKKNNLLNIFELQGLSYDDSYKHHLCVTIVDDLYRNKINSSYVKNDLLNLKALISSVFDCFDSNISYLENDQNHTFILKNNSFIIEVNNERIGIAGQINPEVLKEMNFIENKPIYFFEINITSFINKKHNDLNIIVKPEKTLQENVKYITTTTKKDISYKKIFNVLKEIEKNNDIKNINLEAVFKKEEEISYTFSFILNTQKNINEKIEDIIRKFESNNITIKK